MKKFLVKEKIEYQECYLFESELDFFTQVLENEELKELEFKVEEGNKIFIKVEEQLWCILRLGVTKVLKDKYVKNRFYAIDNSGCFEYRYEEKGD